MHLSDGAIGPHEAGQGEPDLFRIEFFNAANQRLYRFDGRVIDGNLTVRP